MLQLTERIICMNDLNVTSTLQLRYLWHYLLVKLVQVCNNYIFTLWFSYFIFLWFLSYFVWMSISSMTWRWSRSFVTMLKRELSAYSTKRVWLNPVTGILFIDNRKLGKWISNPFNQWMNNHTRKSISLWCSFSFQPEFIMRQIFRNKK